MRIRGQLLADGLLHSLIWIFGLCPTLLSQLDISYNAFVRTTDSRHEALVRQVLDVVWSRGDIYKASYDGW
jgi:hypothetical protein